VFEKAGVKLRLFHGRGGTVAVAAAQLRSHPGPAAGTVNGQIRLTEQGEIIASKFSNKDIGRRNLELLVAATWKRAWRRRKPSRPAPSWRSSKPSWPRFRTAPTRPTATSCMKPRLHRLLLLGHADREIAELNLGSRPASRKPTSASKTCAPFPGASGASAACCCRAGWFRQRHRGWIADGDQAERPGAAARHVRQWPFFATLLSNMDMVLAKTDLAIASRYAELVQDKELRERIFKRITEEHGNTLRCLEHHRQYRAPGRQSAAGPLDPEPLRLPRSAEPLAGGTDQAPPRAVGGKQGDERVHRGIHLSINGVAAGLRNTG
jgi:phosphoenolpyruvate carboxylase